MKALLQGRFQNFMTQNKLRQRFLILQYNENGKDEVYVQFWMRTPNIRPAKQAISKALADFWWRDLLSII